MSAPAPAAQHAQQPVFALESAKVARPEFIAMVAMLMALNALAMDVMLPAFPAMRAAYGLENDNAIQYVLSSYLIGFGVSQLFFGPISDRFGRRAPLFIGMGAYMVFAIAGAFAPSFEMLLVARFLQGVGAAGTRVIALASVRDTHSGRAMAATMSLVMMVFMVVPVFAPLLGQLIVIFADWHMVFVFMAAICAVVLVWCLMRMPETLPAKFRRPLTMASVYASFKMILTNRTSFFYALATAFFFGSLFGFLNVAQPLYGEVYGLGEYFAVAFGSVAILMAGSSFANSRLVVKYGQRRLSHGALIAFCVMVIVMALVSLPGNPPFWLFFLMIAVTMPLFGLIGANLNSLALEPMGQIAGTASSVLGFMQTVGGALAGAVIGQFYNGTVFTLAAGFSTVALIALGCVLVAEKGKLFGSGLPAKA